MSSVNYGRSGSLDRFRETQNLMHEALGEFLGYWPWGRGSRPASWYAIRSFATLEASLRKQPNDGPCYAGLSDALVEYVLTQGCSRKGIRLAAEILCRYYSRPALGADQSLGNVVTTAQCSAFDIGSYAPDAAEYVQPFVDLNGELERVRESLVGAYLFGSYATSDFIPGWSDADVLLILSRRVFRSPEALLAFRQRLLKAQRYLYQVDPLQLHGFFVLTWADMLWYPQFYYPTMLFEHSVALVGADAELAFHVRDDLVERQDTFRRSAQYLMRLAGSGIMPTTHGEQKLYYHKIFTLPLLFLQALGMHVYKKHSFRLAEAQCPECNWSCLDKPSTWMRERRDRLTIEKAVLYVARLNPFVRAKLLSSWPYRRLASVRRPLWGVHSDEFNELATKVADLVSCCLRHINSQQTTVEERRYALCL